MCLKFGKKCSESDPTNGLEPASNGWKMSGLHLKPDWYVGKCLPEQLVKDIDSDKSTVAENSDNEWTDESDNEIM